MAKNAKVSNSHMLLGTFQLQVLQSVRCLGDAAYGIQIRRRLEKLMTKEVHTPQVYAALLRLEKLGMISSFIDTKASAGQRGRPRRVYSIEAPGQRMLEAGAILSSTVPGKEFAHASPKGTKAATA